MIDQSNRSLFDGVEEFDDIGDIYNRMEANCPRPKSSSKRLWELRHEVSISRRNTSAETMLEKSVASLAHVGRMPGWFNQCPTASGIGDSSRYRRSTVDLVHWSEADRTARLVELKWESDDPCKALRQILGYGAAYVFCRRHFTELPLKNRPLMTARHISLEVVAPAKYFRRSGVEAHLGRMRNTLERFDVGSRLPGLSLSLDALAFPDDFTTLPFTDGGEVRKLCGGEDCTEAARRVRDAFANLKPARSA